MLLDELVTTIETVQDRIRVHGNSLSQNEYRTRISLVDPVLNALGWNVSDPKQVTPEYPVDDKAHPERVDYALLVKGGNDEILTPRAFIEAKSLETDLEKTRHELQVLNYARNRGIRYIGMTNGNRWIFEDYVAGFTSGEGKLLDVTISKASVHACALKFLLLWHPTLAAGQPIEPNEPILVTPSEPHLTVDTPDPTTDQQQPPPSPPSGWLTPTEYNPSRGGRPPTIRVPGKGEFEVRYWYDIVIETAEWLIRAGDLTASQCPLKKGTLSIHTVDDTPRRNYMHTSELSNGLFLNIKKSIKDVLAGTAFLTQHFHQSPSSILLKSN